MRYYWIKLNKDFFHSPKIKYVLKQRNGPTVIVVYIQLLLFSLDTKGYIQPAGFAASIDEELAIAFDLKVTIITAAINTLKKVGLVIEQSNNSLYLPDLDAMVGSEATSTTRSRESREKKKKRAKKEKECDNPQDENASDIDVSPDQDENASVTAVSPDQDGHTSVCNLPHSAEILVEAWNSLEIEGISKVLRVEPGSKREEMLLSLVDRYSEAELITAVDNIEKSEYLCGKNENGRVIAFDWFIIPENFLKVLENRYLDAVPTQAVKNFGPGFSRFEMMKDW